MTDAQSVIGKVKEFILSEFLPGEDPNELEETTPLMTTGILDSLATLKLVTFIENTFAVSIAPHEIDSENMNTLADIAKLVSSKS